MRYVLVMLALAGALHQSFASAQSYPNKPVRVIVPVPAGGTPDITARLVMPELSGLLKQQFVVDNRPGAGSLIGAEIAAKAQPDGYTLLFSSGGPLTILPHLQKKMPYRPLQDLAPISLISSGPFVLITHPSSPFKSIGELATLAKRTPGRFNYASAGNGSPNHLATELFKTMSGIDVTHVPYKGAPQGVTDVLANQINLNFSSIPPVLGHVRAGRLRALATTGKKSSALLPDVPTITDTVAPGYEFTSWFGMLAPARTPSAVISRLHEAVATVMRSPETRAQFEKRGADVVASSPAEFGEHLRREFDRNGKAVKAAGIRID